MTDPRDRVITDPGIGPVNLEASTLRSIAAAEPVPSDPGEPPLRSAPSALQRAPSAGSDGSAEEVEPDGASLYYEPKPLASVSNHKTLEIATVKLADDIDPRRLPTEISLPRTPRTPEYDSAWPQAEVVLTTSQRPLAPTRWRLPALLLTVLASLLVLLFVRGMARRASERASAATPIAATPPAPPLVSRGKERLTRSSATPLNISASLRPSALATLEPPTPAASALAASAPTPALAASALAASASAPDLAARAPAASAARALPTPHASSALGAAEFSAPTLSAPANAVASADVTAAKRADSTFNARIDSTSAAASNVTSPAAKPKRAIY